MKHTHFFAVPLIFMSTASSAFTLEEKEVSGFVNQSLPVMINESFAGKSSEISGIKSKFSSHVAYENFISDKGVLLSERVISERLIHEVRDIEVTSVNQVPDEKWRVTGYFISDETGAFRDDTITYDFEADITDENGAYRISDISIMKRYPEQKADDVAEFARSSLKKALISVSDDETIRGLFADEQSFDSFVQAKTSYDTDERNPRYRVKNLDMRNITKTDDANGILWKLRGDMSYFPSTDHNGEIRKMSVVSTIRETGSGYGIEQIVVSKK